MWWHWESFFVCTLFGVALVFIYLIAETLLSCWYHRCLLRLTVTCLREYFQEGSAYRNSHGLWGEGAEILLLWWCWIVKLVTAALMRRWKIVSDSEFGCPTMPHSYDWFLHITPVGGTFPTTTAPNFTKLMWHTIVKFAKVSLGGLVFYVLWPHLFRLRSLRTSRWICSIPGWNSSETTSSTFH